MKTIRFLAVFVALSSPLWAAPNEAAFSKKLLDVYQRADVEGFLSLVEDDETTPEEIRKLNRDTFASFAKKTVTGATFEAVSGKETTSYQRDGVTFITSLPPVLKMIVTFDDKEQRPKILSITYLLGIKGSEYRIVSVKVQKKPNQSSAAPRP